MQDEFKLLVKQLKLEWSLKEKAKNNNNLNSESISNVAPFLFLAIDKLIKLANEFNVSGVIKRGIVLEAVSELYDSLVNPLIPFYLKPFSGKIKRLIVNVVIGSLIDLLFQFPQEQKNSHEFWDTK